MLPVTAPQEVGAKKAGANGAQVEFTASNQTLNGDIAVDTVSTLNMTLTDSSDFTGTINIIDNAQNGTAVDNNAVVTIDSDSTWTLTGDCTVTSLENNGTINFNGHTITLADGTVLQINTYKKMSLESTDIALNYQHKIVQEHVRTPDSKMMFL